MMKSILQNLPINHLYRNPYQMRQEFDSIALAELAQSIRSSGLIQPIIVRPKTGQTQYYEIIAGERRWRAAKLAGLNEISCLIKNCNDEQSAEIAAIENLQRVDLNPIEEAESYLRLIKEFGYSHEETAAIIGKSRTKISNSLRLLKLHPQIQQLLRDGNLSEGHGKILAGLPEFLQCHLAKKALSRGWNVRIMEQQARQAQQQRLNPPKIWQKDINIRALEKALAEHLGCKVSLQDNEEKGQLTIDFHNLDILEGILEKMQFKFNLSA